MAGVEDDVSLNHNKAERGGKVREAPIPRPAREQVQEEPARRARARIAAAQSSCCQISIDGLPSVSGVRRLRRGRTRTHLHITPAALPSAVMLHITPMRTHSGITHISHARH